MQDQDMIEDNEVQEEPAPLDEDSEGPDKDASQKFLNTDIRVLIHLSSC